jgi:hypothetical protein
VELHRLSFSGELDRGMPLDLRLPAPEVEPKDLV